MNNFATASEKLQTLLATGLITQQEFDAKRAALLDNFVGLSGSTPAARPPMRRALPNALPATWTPARPYARPGRFAGGMGRGMGMGAGMGMGMGMGAGMGMGMGMMGMGMPMGMGMGMPYGRGRGGMGYHPYGMGGMERPSNIPTFAIKVVPIPEGIRPEVIKAAFTPFGEVASVALQQSPTGPYCFVNFTNCAAATAAATSGGVEIAGTYPTITLSQRRRPLPKSEGEPTSGIGIFNLPFTITEEEILGMLQQCPGFQTMKMVFNKVGAFRGYCFAYFDCVENAMGAKSMLLGQMVGPNVIDVKFSKQPIEEAMQPKLMM